MFSLPASTRTTLSRLKYHLNSPYSILFLPKKLSLKKKKSDAMDQWSWDSRGFIIYQESLTDKE